MSEYPGVARTSARYFLKAVSNSLVYIVFMVLLTIFALPPLLVSKYGGLALFAYVGLAIYMAHLDLSDNVGSVDDIDEPKPVKILITFVLLAYYNVLIILATGFGATTAVRWGYPSLAPAVALLIPFVDGELARMNTLSFGLFVVIVVGILSKLAEFVSLIQSDEADEVREAIPDPSSILEASLRRLHTTKSAFL